MRFGPVPLAEAAGAVLAHSVPLGGRRRLRKGRILGAEDLAALAAAGVAEVVVARLDPGDVDEDSAARQLAEALVPDPRAAGLRLTAAATGRVNLIATGPGVLEVDASRIAAVNAVGEGITVATLPEWRRVAEGMLAATIKIIPYGVPGAALGAACAAGSGALARRSPVLTEAHVITTGPGAKAAEMPPAAVLDRLTRIGAGPVRMHRVAHEAETLAGLLQAPAAPLVLILSDTATSDARDVVPEAIRRAGGRVLRYGMPVDPGNLLVLGEVPGATVIGLPGCATSIALNGADWVLERVICGVPVTGADIAAMGVGGLLKEVPTRPQPRRSAASAGPVDD